LETIGLVGEAGEKLYMAKLILAIFLDWLLEFFKQTLGETYIIINIQ